MISATPCQKCSQCLTGSPANCLNSRRIGIDAWGGYAEYITVPSRYAVKLPDELSFADGTVITRHFPMAFNLLVSKAEVKPAEWVLVMGATGALGSSCVQVAKMLGAKVIAGAGADDRVAAALEQGADFGVNYRKNNLTEEVMKLTDNKGVDVVCENIADPTLWPARVRQSRHERQAGHRRRPRRRHCAARCETALHAPAPHLRRRGNQYCRRGKISPSRRPRERSAPSSTARCP